MCIGIFGHVSREFVTELILLRYNLESATQRSVSISCLWRLRGRRWRWWTRWRRWTLEMFAMLSSRFMPFRRRRRLLGRRGWRSTSIATLILRVLVFVWSFYFFVLRSTSPHFPFPRDSPRWVLCANFPLIFVGPHERRASNFILRMELLSLSIYYCINCIIASHWWMKYQLIPIW